MNALQVLSYVIISSSMTIVGHRDERKVKYLRLIVIRRISLDRSPMVDS